MRTFLKELAVIAAFTSNLKACLSEPESFVADKCFLTKVVYLDLNFFVRLNRFLAILTIVHILLFATQALELIQIARILAANMAALIWCKRLGINHTIKTLIILSCSMFSK